MFCPPRPFTAPPPLRGGVSKPPMKESESDITVKVLDKGDPNIVVAVRVRPFSTAERTQSTQPIIRVLDEHVIIFDAADNDDDQVSGRFLNKKEQIMPFESRRAKDQRYAFDRVFDTSSTQAEVYENTTKFLIENVMNGFNATVFAYGATGAGKTYTMMGSDSSGPGVMVLTMIDLFRVMEKRQHEKTYNVTISYLEVYNETIRDLLTPEGIKSPPLSLREDPVQGICVAGLSQHHPASADQVLDLLQKGNGNRTQHGTAVNAESSRSHAVLQIRIEQKDRTAGLNTDVKIGKLSLIDLAGSERASRTLNRGQRLVEGANINKSLLALGNCINALADPKKANGFVPYRDSKLTRLLKDSLGGNCRTVMIANISPSAVSYEDTLNTLKYANRAKNIKTTVVRNVRSVNFHISQYKKIIEELRAEVAELKSKVSEKEERIPPHIVEKMEREQREKQVMEDMRKEITQTYSDLINARRNIMELEEKSCHSVIDAHRKRLELQRWQREHPDEDEASAPIMIHTLRKDLKLISERSREHTLAKTALTTFLEEKTREANALQQTIPQRVETPEYRLFLEQQVRIHEMEIQNLDFDRVLQNQRAKEQITVLQLEESQFTLSRTSAFIQEQFSMLKAHGLVSERTQREFDLVRLLCNEHTNLNPCGSPMINGEQNLDFKHIYDALTTPYGLSIRKPKARRISGGEFRSNNIFNLTIPNSPKQNHGISRQLVQAYDTENMDLSSPLGPSTSDAPPNTSIKTASPMDSAITPVSVLTKRSHPTHAPQDEAHFDARSALQRKLEERRRYRKQAKLAMLERNQAWVNTVEEKQSAAPEAPAKCVKFGNVPNVSKHVKFEQGQSSSRQTPHQRPRPASASTQRPRPSAFRGASLYPQSQQQQQLSSQQDPFSNRPYSAGNASTATTPLAQPPTVSISLDLSRAQVRCKPIRPNLR